MRRIGGTFGSRCCCSCCCSFNRPGKKEEERIMPFVWLKIRFLMRCIHLSIYLLLRLHATNFQLLGSLSYVVKCYTRGLYVYWSQELQPSTFTYLRLRLRALCPARNCPTDVRYACNCRNFLLPGRVVIIILQTFISLSLFLCFSSFGLSLSQVTRTVKFSLFKKKR